MSGREIRGYLWLVLQDEGGRRIPSGSLHKSSCERASNRDELQFCCFKLPAWHYVGILWKRTINDKSWWDGQAQRWIETNCNYQLMIQFTITVLRGVQKACVVLIFPRHSTHYLAPSVGAEFIRGTTLRNTGSGECIMQGKDNSTQGPPTFPTLLTKYCCTKQC